MGDFTLRLHKNIEKMALMRFVYIGRGPEKENK